MPHRCNAISPKNAAVDKVTCMNSLCKQRGIQAVALRGLKLTDLEYVVSKVKHRLKVALVRAKQIEMILQNLFLSRLY